MLQETKGGTIGNNAIWSIDRQLELDMPGIHEQQMLM
jgi:hypothetical protein